MRILINRSDAIGDTILTLPMAKLIKDRFSDSHITFILSEKSQPLAKHLSYIDDIWVIPSRLGMWRRLFFFWSKFKKAKFDAYFFVGGFHGASIIAMLKRVRIRGGLLSKFTSFISLKDGVRQQRSFVEMHESEYNMNILKPLGVSYSHTEKEAMFPELNVTDEEQSVAHDNLKAIADEQGVTLLDEYLVIHPGMVGHTLNWSSRNYVRMLERIDRIVGERFSYIISFTPSDKPYLIGVEDELDKPNMVDVKKRVVLYDGSKHGLRDYMGVLKRASVFIGPSTGTTHIANSLKVKQVTIFSPIKVQSLLRWGPYNRDKSLVKTLVPDVVCGEQFRCALSSCPYYECMSKIEIDDVVANIFELIKKES